MADKVYLIGATGFDIFAGKRFDIALQRFRPDTVVLHGDKDTINNLKKQVSEIFAAEEKMRKDNNLPPLQDYNRGAVESFLAGEVFAAASYAAERGATLAFVPFESRLIENYHEEVIEKVLGDAEREEEWDFLMKNSPPQNTILIKAWGRARLHMLRSMGVAFPEALHRQGPLDLLLRGNNEEIRKAQEILDCIYFLPRQSLRQSLKDAGDDAERRALEQEMLETSARLNEAVAEKIASLEGRVVHLTNLGFAFGEHPVCYNKLREKGMDVESFKLLDFYPDTMRAVMVNYEKNLRKKLERWKLGRSMPEISGEYIEAYACSPDEEKVRRLDEALQHFQQWNNALYEAVVQVSYALEIESPALFQRLIADTYMTLLDHVQPLPIISGEEYKDLEKKLLGSSSDAVLYNIEEIMAVENPSLHKSLATIIKSKGNKNTKHFHGALVVYKLLRDAYLKTI